MWKDESTVTEGEQPNSASWVLWVVGWGLLTGAGVVVTPVFLFFGTHAATWAAGGVGLAVAIIGWLGAEAEKAVSVDHRTRARVVAQAPRGKTSTSQT